MLILQLHHQLQPQSSWKHCLCVWLCLCLVIKTTVILNAVLLFSLNHVQLFVTPWTAAHQASLSFIISWSLLNFKSIESVMPFNHFIPYHPFSFHLRSFPASRIFPMSQLFTSGVQSIGASTPVLPVNIQGWFPLGLTSLISLLYKGLLRVFSSMNSVGPCLN